MNCRFQPSLSMRIRAARANSSTSCNLFNPCNSFNSFDCGSAALCQSVSIGVHPWLIPLARAYVFALTADFWISCVDVAAGQTRRLEPRAGYISGRAEPFYGTMAGPWRYHIATIVPQVRNLPFSALRLLIQLTRKPPSCRPCSLFHQPLAEALDALQALLDVRHIGVRTNAFHFPSH